VCPSRLCDPRASGTEHEGKQLIGWVECGTHKDYPTIGLGITRAEGNEPHEPRPVLFDTGSDSTYVADFVFPVEIQQEIEEENSWILGARTSPTRGKSSPFSFKRARVKLELSDGNNRLSGVGTVNYVPKWDESPFVGSCALGACAVGAKHCDTRIGLVSASILSDLKVEVVLNGGDRTLSIRPADASTQRDRRAAGSSRR